MNIPDPIPYGASEHMLDGLACCSVSVTLDAGPMHGGDPPGMAFGHEGTASG